MKTVCGLLLIGSLWAGSLAGQAPGCERFTLTTPPTWSSSAAWSADGRELVIADNLGGRLLRYSQGKLIGSVSRPGLGPLEFNQPARVSSIPGGYLLENPSAKILWLDAGFRPWKSVDFETVKAGRAIKEEILGFGLLSPTLAGKDLLSYAILHRDGKPWLGFVRVSLEPFAVQELIDEVKPGSQEDRIFRLQGQELAQAAGGTYVLRFGERAYIQRLAPGKQRLKAFPAGFEALPKLESLNGASAGPTLFKMLEASTTAVKVYGRGAYLYLLTRKPEPAGTRWQLWQIDPKRDAVVRGLDLPTHANHIYLAPGPQRWAVVEKGPVTPSSEQSIRTVLLLPAPWIEDLQVKALADGKTIACR